MAQFGELANHAPLCPAKLLKGRGECNASAQGGFLFEFDLVIAIQAALDQTLATADENLRQEILQGLTVDVFHRFEFALIETAPSVAKQVVDIFYGDWITHRAAC